MSQCALLGAVCLLVLGPQSTAAQARYVAATVNQQGNLLISVEKGDPIIVLLEREAPVPGWKQVGFRDIAVAQSGYAVAWISVFSDCGPVGLNQDGYCPGMPTKLGVHSHGRLHTYGNGVPIWKWAFLAKGSQVGYMQMTLHGSNEEYYELRDLANDRVVAKYVLDILESRPDVPEWVQVVASKRPQ